MFENKMIDTPYGPTHMSRFIASWYIGGGPRIVRCAGNCEFGTWLKAEGLTDEQIYETEQMAINGKLEHEVRVRRYLKENNIESTRR